MLHTDSSKNGLGAVLEHEQDDNQMNPDAYVSRYVNKHECNYGITDMEAFGSCVGLKHFQAYLFGHRCVIYTNHPLRHCSPHSSGKLAKWGNILLELDLEIWYKPGRQNAMPMCCLELV